LRGVIELCDSGLTVSVLEPERDAARLGARYCSGAYVWQVTDERYGPLCAGPCFPAPEPPPFDGQGLPEVFEIALGQDRAKVGDEVYVLGVGRVLRESAVRPFHVRDNPRVVERAAWDVHVAGGVLIARCAARFEGFAFDFTRTLALRGRVLESATRLVNTGGAAIPLRWFAHPFFPWPDGDVCRLSLEHSLPEDAALFVNPRGFVERSSGSDWRRGHYLLPRVALGGELEVEQCHPALGRVRVSCRFPLGQLALWGNQHTFSFEPFLLSVISPRAEASWGIAYDFAYPG
jgi:hypothetical protein